MTTITLVGDGINGEWRRSEYPDHCVTVDYNAADQPYCILGVGRGVHLVADAVAKGGEMQAIVERIGRISRERYG